MVLPKPIQDVHYERLPTRLQWSRLCGTVDIIECISKREIKGRGGHHSVKMVTAAWRQQAKKSADEGLQMLRQLN